MNTRNLPAWFRDSFSRVDELGFTLRLNEDSRQQVQRIADELGWSNARVVRVLVNKALAELPKA